MKANFLTLTQGHLNIKIKIMVYSRVPTGTGKHGKWLTKIPCMEKSWNLKNEEISWKNHGILL